MRPSQYDPMSLPRTRIGSDQIESDDEDFGQPTEAVPQVDDAQLQNAQNLQGDEGLQCTFDGCGKLFKDKKVLRKHMMTHQPRRFHCQHEGCGKSFYERAKLKRHNLVHSGEKRFVCSFEGCDKRFALKANLQTHFRVHTGTRPFECPFPGCNKRFSQTSGRNSHYKTHLKRNKRKFESENSETDGAFDNDTEIDSHQGNKRALTSPHESEGSGTSWSVESASPKQRSETISGAMPTADSVRQLMSYSSSDMSVSSKLSMEGVELGSRPSPGQYFASSPTFGLGSSSVGVVLAGSSPSSSRESPQFHAGRTGDLPSFIKFLGGSVGEPTRKMSSSSSSSSMSMESSTSAQQQSNAASTSRGVLFPQQTQAQSPEVSPDVVSAANWTHFLKEVNNNSKTQVDPQFSYSVQNEAVPLLQFLQRQRSGQHSQQQHKSPPPMVPQHQPQPSHVSPLSLPMNESSPLSSADPNSSVSQTLFNLLSSPVIKSLLAGPSPASQSLGTTRPSSFQTYLPNSPQYNMEQNSTSPVVPLNSNSSLASLAIGQLLLSARSHDSPQGPFSQRIPGEDSFSSSQTKRS